MTVGLIATDAAKVTDSGTVGAKAYSEVGATADDSSVGVNTYFTNGETLFIHAADINNSAYGDSATVKAWFMPSGSAPITAKVGGVNNNYYSAVFIGVILTATSVSITVQALREMGKLKGTIGTTILSAAIIDDVIGIIVLTVVVGLSNGSVSAGTVCLKTALFFVFSIVVGLLIYKLFKFFDSRYPHTRRIPIMGLALCLAMSYVAEKYFGIADITGAYVAGIILCNIRDSEYIAEKMDINS